MWKREEEEEEEEGKKRKKKKGNQNKSECTRHKNSSSMDDYIQPSSAAHAHLILFITIGTHPQWEEPLEQSRIGCHPPCHQMWPVCACPPAGIPILRPACNHSLG
jgi:hypothetical protein